MPQTKSAIKSLRQDTKKTLRNQAVKKDITYLLRQFKKAIETGDKDKATEFSQKLIKSLDKAAQKNIIKKNTAARKKSRMMKKVNQIKK